MKRNINIFEFPLDLGLTKRKIKQNPVFEHFRTGLENLIFIKELILRMFSGQRLRNTPCTLIKISEMQHKLLNMVKKSDCIITWNRYDDLEEML